MIPSWSPSPRLPRPHRSPRGRWCFTTGCGLCARSVRWILTHERDHALQFAPLRDPTAAALRARYPRSDDLAEGGLCRRHARDTALEAFLHMAKQLRKPWRWAHAVRWLPGFVLDLGYRVIAAIRYRVWGTVDSCDLPAPEQRVRFLP